MRAAPPMTGIPVQVSPSPLMRELVASALAAGRAVLEIYERGPEVKVKPDSSPLTDADLASERIILARLAKLAPGVPVVSEEASSEDMPPVGERFFLVDPLDGTKEFLNRNGEFTVNIALIEKGEPMLGVVYAPAKGRLFWGERGQGAGHGHVAPDAKAESVAWQPLSVRMCPEEGAIVVASRSHRDLVTDAWLAAQKVGALVSAGSSLKFCLLACGEADLYPRFGRTMEWDTAAGHAVLAAAGGRVETTDGAALTYGKHERGFDNPGFIARGK